MSTKDVFIEALSLPTRSRAELAEKLLVSLEKEGESPEVGDEWDKEARRRYAAYKKGKITARDSAAVMRDAYKRVR